MPESGRAFPPGGVPDDLAGGLARYLDQASLARLACARIGIAGAGGLGSNVAMLLVRSGIRRLRILDHDRVEASNLNRQCYWPEDIGKPKVEALAARLAALEPGLDCETRVLRLSAGDAPALFQGCSIVVEALDDAPLKAALCAALVAAGFFVVAASGLAGCGGPPMRTRRLGAGLVLVGDGQSDVDDFPPLAPRVMQAAALQADVVLARILGLESPAED